MNTERYNAAVGEFVINRCAALLKQGEIVAFPTETVYGLGAIAWDKRAVQKVFEAKGRPQDNPLIVHVASFEQVFDVASEVPEEAQLLMEAFWPGPLTLVLPKHRRVPNVVTAGLDTVCVRMPSDPVALRLIRAAGAPIVAPSANLSGKPSPTTADHVMDDLNGRIAAVLDGGQCDVGIESTVLDLTHKTPMILRPGVISAEELHAVLQQPIEMVDTASLIAVAKDAETTEAPAPHAPGMKYRHYAPHAAVVLVYDWEEAAQILEDQRMTVEDVVVLSNAQVPAFLDHAETYPIATQSLYAHFRDADAAGKRCIFIYVDSETAEESGIMNRIMKAAAA